MTQTTDRTPPSLPPLLAELSRAPERAPGPVAAVLGGALAAGLGLGALTALVMLLWIGSPYPDSGVGGALHVAAALWLLAHGGELTRTATLSGVPAPVGVTPLLLAALPVWLAYRAGHEAARPASRDRPPRADGTGTAGTGRAADGSGAGERERSGTGSTAGTRGTGTGRGSGAGRPSGAPSPVVPVRAEWPSPWTAWCGVVLGYLLLAWAVARYADHGTLRPDWTSAAVRTPLLVAAAAAAGVWRARTRLRARLMSGRRTTARRPVPPGQAPAAGRRATGGGSGRRVLVVTDGGRRTIDAERHGRPAGTGPVAVAGPSGRTLTRRRLRAALRAGAAATLVLLAGGALLAVLPLVRHELEARTLFLRLAEDGSGRTALLLLALALLPNAAVWGAAFTLGPGFAFRAGHLLAPLGTAPVPLLPGSPSLPVVPSGGYGTPYTWLAGVVPLAAGLTVAWCTAQAAAPAYGERAAAWSWARTALVAAGGATSCGLAVALLSAYAGGPMGVHGLARFGPVWWQTGAAALVWTLVIGVPAVLVLRAWRVRN